MLWSRQRRGPGGSVRQRSGRGRGHWWAWDMGGEKGGTRRSAQRPKLVTARPHVLCPKVLLCKQCPPPTRFRSSLLLVQKLRITHPRPAGAPPPTSSVCGALETRFPSALAKRVPSGGQISHGSHTRCSNLLGDPALWGGRGAGRPGQVPLLVASLLWRRHSRLTPSRGRVHNRDIRERIIFWALPTPPTVSRLL